MDSAGKVPPTSANATTTQPQYGACYSVGAPPPSYGHVMANGPTVGQGYPPPGTHIVSQNYPLPVMTQPHVQFQDHTTLSVISMFFCTCLGIFSFLKASDAKTLMATGQYQAALEKARAAKNLAMTAIILGASIVAVVVLVNIILVIVYSDYDDDYDNDTYN